MTAMRRSRRTAIRGGDGDFFARLEGLVAGGELRQKGSAEGKPSKMMWARTRCRRQSSGAMRTRHVRMSGKCSRLKGTRACWWRGGSIRLRVLSGGRDSVDEVDLEAKFRVNDL